MLKFYNKNHVDITDERVYCGNSECLVEPWCSAWGICRAQQSATMEQEVSRLCDLIVYLLWAFSIPATYYQE